MLVCVSFSTLAHETAGAACTRLSLRPLFRERAERNTKLGQIMSREYEAASPPPMSSPGLCAIAHMDRATQYAAAHRLNHTVSGILDRPDKPGDDTCLVIETDSLRPSPPQASGRVKCMLNRGGRFLNPRVSRSCNFSHLRSKSNSLPPSFRIWSGERIRNSCRASLRYFVNS